MYKLFFKNIYYKKTLHVAAGATAYISSQTAMTVKLNLIF